MTSTPSGELEYLQSYVGKRILVSGARGYLGSSLVSSLASVPCELILLDRGNSAWLPPAPKAKIESVAGDATQSAPWEECLERKPDIIFPLAALEYDRKNFQWEADLRANCYPAMKMVESCHQKNLRPRIIFPSSTNIFGAVKVGRVSEDTLSVPPSVWSAHKLLAENYLRISAQKHGLPITSIRLPNLYGIPARRDIWQRMVLNRVIYSALSAGKIYAYQNKGCARDFLHVGDAVAAFLAAGSSPAARTDGGFYVLGSGETQTLESAWRLVCKLVEQLSGKRVEIECQELDNLEELDFRSYVSDSAALKKVTGWRPAMSLEMGIKFTAQALAGENL